MKTKLLKTIICCTGLFIATLSNSQVAPTASFSISADTVCAGADIQVTDLSTDFPTAWSYSVNGLSFSAVQNPLLTFTLAGTYTLDLEATNGVGASAVFSGTFYVHALPLISVSGNTVICAGNAGTLTVSGTDTYTWDSGSNTESLVVTPVANTIYTVVGTSTVNGCSDSLFVQVTVEALPVISVSDATICAGETYTISPSGADVYTYSGGSDLVSPTTNASYTVTGTSTLTGCSDSVAVSISVNASPTITVNSGSICAGEGYTLIPAGAVNYTFSSGTNTVAPLTNTTYVIEGEDVVTGCIGAVTASVFVNPTPTITVNSGTICAGEVFTLVPGGASSYTFSSGSETVMPLTTAEYSVTGEDAQGCIALAPAVATVVISGTIPSVTITSSATGIICAGDQAVLTAFGATSYSWSTGETTSTIVISPTITTLFTVDGEDGLSGCMAGASILQYVSDCTGIESFTQELHFNSYPNPTHGAFIIDVESSMHVRVTNTLGQEVLNQALNPGKNDISLYEQPDGIYFVTLLQNNSTKTIRLIKQ